MIDVPPVAVADTRVVLELTSTTKDKTADIPKASKAKSDLEAIAKSQGKALFGWTEITTGSIDDWFKEPDGMLIKAGWQDDQATRDYVANAQIRAGELGREWALKINNDLKISNQDAAKKPVSEIIDAAKKAGINVDQSTLDGANNFDLLSNGHETARQLAVDENKIMQGVEQQASAAQQAREAALAGILFPDAAELMLGLLAREDLEKALEKRAQRFIKKGIKIEGDQAIVVDAKKVAFAVDMQIAGIKWNLSSLQMKIEDPDQKNSLPELQKKRDELADKLAKLLEQRASEKLEVEMGGKKYSLQRDEIKNEPNQIVELAIRLGAKPDATEGNPIAAISSTIPTRDNFNNEGEYSAAVGGFVKKMSDAAGLDAGAQKRLADVLIKGPAKTAKQWGVDTLKYGGGGVSILFILAIWMSAFEKEQR